MAPGGECCGRSPPCVKPDLLRALNEVDADPSKFEPPRCIIRSFGNGELDQFGLKINGDDSLSCLGARNSPREIKDIPSKATPFSDSTPGLWRINESKFQIRSWDEPTGSYINDPNVWNTWLDTVALKVSTDLGVGPCTLKLRGMLVAEEEAFLKPCKFVVNAAEGGFGTLMMFLPDYGTEQIFLECAASWRSCQPWSDKIEDAYYYAAWFSDVSYGFTPVNTLYRNSLRVMLEFELLTTAPSSPPIACTRPGGENGLLRALDSWEQNQTEHRYLCHVLDPVYQTKEPERCVEYVSALQEHIYHKGFTVLLADVSKKLVKSLKVLKRYKPEKHKSPPRYKAELHSEEKYSMSIYLPGAINAIVEDFEIVRNNILEDSCFETLSPCKGETASYVTGQALRLGTWWYGDIKAVVIFPDHEFHSMLTNNLSRPHQDDLSVYLVQRSWTQSLFNNEFWQHTKPALMRIDPQTWDDELFMKTVQACLRFSDYQFFCHLLRSHHPITRGGDCWSCSADTCDCERVENLLRELRFAVIMNRSCASNLVFQEGLSKYLDSFKNFQTRYDHFAELSLFKIRDKSTVAFVDSELSRIVELPAEHKDLSDYGAKFLVHISFAHSMVAEFLENKVLPIIDEPAAAVCGFLRGLLCGTIHSNPGQYPTGNSCDNCFFNGAPYRAIDPNAAFRIFEKLWKRVRPRAFLEDVAVGFHDLDKYRYTLDLPETSLVWKPTCYSISSKSLAGCERLFRCLETLGWLGLASELASAMADEPNLLQNAELWCISVPLLKGILSRHEPDSPQLKNPGYQKLFTRVLFRFALLFTARTEPSLESCGDTGGCRCSFCKALDVFKASQGRMKEFAVIVREHELEHIRPVLDGLSLTLGILKSCEEGDEFREDGDEFRLPSDEFPWRTGDGTEGHELRRHRILVRRLEDSSAAWRSIHIKATQYLRPFLDSEVKLEVLIGQGAYKALKSWVSGGRLTQEDIRLYDPEAFQDAAPLALARKRRFSGTDDGRSEDGQQGFKKRA